MLPVSVNQAAPLLTIFLYSFMTDGYLEIIYSFTFSNYVEAWTNPLYRVVMLRSLGVSLAVTAATVLLAFPVAYFVSFHVEGPKKSLWLFLITIPYWVNLLIRTVSLKFLIRDNGPLNEALIGKVSPAAALNASAAEIEAIFQKSGRKTGRLPDLPL